MDAHDLDLPVTAPDRDTARETSGLAIASLVLGILSVGTCAVFGIPGLITGYRARKQIRQEPDRLTGDGMALAGIITSWIGTVVSTVAFGAVMLLVVWGGSAADNANLDALDRPAGETSRTTADVPRTPDGTWTVTPGEQVFVGYRIEELFGGETVKKTAVGRTPAVSGTMKISGQKVESVEIKADVAQLKSDQSRRDSVVRNRGLQTDLFPEATFKLAEPLVLPGAPKQGQEVSMKAKGELTLHGQTKPVDLDLKAKWTGDEVLVSGSAPIALADFGIEVISMPVVTIDEAGTMEFQLRFVPST